MTGREDFRDAPPVSVDDILDGNVPAERLSELDDDIEEGATPAPAKGEPEAEAPKADDGTPPPPESEPGPEKKDEPAKPPVDVKGIIDERRKRQDAERRAEEAERRLQDLERRPPQRPQPQQQPQQQPQRPDPLDDPEGARRWDEATADERDFQRTCLLTESFMVELKGEDDYREKENAFLQAAERNPALAAALRRSANPAKFAYSEGAKLLLMQEVGGDPKAWRTKVETEIREKVEAELREKLEKEFAARQPAPVVTPQVPKPQVPKTLATMQSNAPRDTKDTFQGPVPLSQILGE